MVEPNRFVHTIVLILSFSAELGSDILTFLNVVNNFKFVVIMILDEIYCTYNKQLKY